MVNRKRGSTKLWTAAIALVGVALVGPADPSAAEELSFWTNLTVKAHADVIQRHVNECLPSVPGTTVRFETVAFDAMYPRLLTALKDGNPPNIMNTTEDAVGWIQARDGIVPVDDLVSALNRDDFVPSYLRPVMKGDKTWGVPDWALHQEVWYRTDLFQKAGLEVPRSWDALLKAAKALTQDTNGDGKIDVYGFGVPMSPSVGVGAHTLFQFLYADGVYVFDPKTGAYAFDKNKAKAVKALQFMVDLYKAASPPASVEWSIGQYRTAFVEGQVAMTNEWGAVVLLAQERNPGLLDKISVFPLPAPTADREPGAALAGGYYYMVGKSTPAKIDASKRLLRCMYDVRRVAERANSRPIFALPATKSAFNSPTFQDHDIVKRFKPQLTIIRDQVMKSWYRYGLEAGLTQLAGQITGTGFVATAVQNVALGKWTAVQAIDHIDEQFRSLLKAP